MCYTTGSVIFEGVEEGSLHRVAPHNLVNFVFVEHSHDCRFILTVFLSKVGLFSISFKHIDDFQLLARNFGAVKMSNRLQADLDLRLGSVPENPIVYWNIVNWTYKSMG